MPGARASLVGIVVVCIGGLAPAAGANVYDVTRHGDPAPGDCRPHDCSLREALLAANDHPGKDLVLLPDRRRDYRLSRPNTSPVSEQAGRRGDLDASGRVVIRHRGHGVATIDAQGVDRALEVLPGGRAKLVSIRLTGGAPATQPPPRGPPRRGDDPDGGGIYSDGGRITMFDSKVVGNVAGGIFSFGKRLRLARTKVARNEGLYGVLAGNARISRSVIRRNEELGLYLFGGTVKRTTVERNGRTGIAFEGAEGAVRASTVTRNREAGIGITFTSDVSIVNSTVTGNRTRHFGGGIDINGSVGFATVRLRSLTVTNNRADTNDDAFGEGGGVRAAEADVTVVNSIISRNETAGVPNDCSGTFDSSGGNLLSTTDDCVGVGPGFGDILAASPRLGKLKRNGGPTRTRALKAGSPAIGNAVEPAAPNRDQRGVRRDQNPDIGAYERRR